MSSSICIAVCDDEEKYRNIELELCKNYFKEKNISIEVRTFNSGENIIEYCEKIDIVLLDIEMQGVDGIKVKNEFVRQNKNSAIIYITSHEELIRHAFGKNVFGFLTKPISREELFKLLEVIYKDRINQNLLQIEDNVYIRYKDIKYILAEDKYCKIYTKDNEHLVRSKISDFERILASGDFIRIQRSCIINFRYIKCIKQTVIMEDNSIMKIGRNKKQFLKDSYNTYLINNAW